MDFTPQTSFPGSAVSPQQRADHLEMIAERFCGGLLPELKPIWFAFPLSERKTLASGVMGAGDTRFFDALSWPAETELLVLVDPLPRALFRATLASIRDYLHARQPSEDYDLCVFPPSLAWCIAITHLQLGGMIDVFGIGDLPMLTENE
jgi:hypothetical protein